MLQFSWFSTEMEFLCGVLLYSRNRKVMLWCWEVTPHDEHVPSVMGSLGLVIQATPEQVYPRGLST